MPYVMAVLSGLILPVLMMVLKRHYDANPNEWEKIFVFGLLGLLAIGGGAGVLVLAHGGEGGIGNYLVGFLACWSIFIGLMVIAVNGSSALELMREMQGK